MIITFCGHSMISKDVKDKTKKDCFTIAVNGVPFVNADTIENAVSMCLGLHKMSNVSHKIVLTDEQGAQLVVLRA